MGKLIVAALLIAQSAVAGTCASLAELKLPHTTVTSAVESAAFGLMVSLKHWVPAEATICQVALTLKPTADSDIRVELWLPGTGWNGKYMAVGNGGWSGSINRSALAEAFSRGYAASSTDTGHEGSSGSFALRHPEKLIDYAYRSEHEMAVVSKAVIAAYYATPAKHSYWNGCSAGGKQGLMEAQRYPADFDGIVAGSPAANWTRRAFQAIWAAQAVHKTPESFIPAAKYPLIHKAVLAACDKLDGVEDGVLENPRRCAFDPKALECAGADSAACLTGPQVEAARKIYTVLERGSELGWSTWSGAKPLQIALDYFRFVLFEKPDWDYMTLNFDADVARAEQLDGHRINATDPNLAPFYARGGKLIQYHGWNDPQISPGNSVDYFESVLKTVGPAAYRLYMVPGMAHCGGGQGTNNFDMVAALERWVEAGQTPQSIPASNDTRTRPLCPYPQTAVYKGQGSTDAAESFVCQ
jgi:feruloyl esterase